MNRAILKYWITYVMVGLVLVFAYMYIQPSWKHKGEAPLRLATVEGDGAAAAALSVDGEYQYSKTTYSRIELNETGVVHRMDSSYDEWFKPWFSEKPGMQQFDGYKDFLRGKQGYGTYFADKDMLVYANSEHAYGKWVLQLSAMDKHTRKQSDFEMKLPDDNPFASWYTEAVQRNDDGHIIIFGSYRYSSDSQETGQWTTELVRLEISLENKEITSVTSVAAGQDHKGRQTGFLIQDLVFEPVNYLIIRTLEKEKMSYFAYHIQTGKLQPLLLHAVSDNATMFNVEDDKLEYAYSDGAQIHIQSYDLATGQPIGEPLTINAVQWNATDARAKAANEKAVSIIYENKTADRPIAGVAIVDRQSGKVTYRGEVQADGTAEEQLNALRKFNLLGGLALAE